MRLIEAAYGSYVKRKVNSGGYPPYLISVSKNGVYRFMNEHSSYNDEHKFILSDLVKSDSSVWEHNDFEYCDRQGNIKEVKKGKIMNKVKDVNYIGGEYKVVKVHYLNEKTTYNFKIDAALTVNPGDIVVVESTRGLGLCEVEEVYDNVIANADEIKVATAWVVNIVDMTAHKQRQDATAKRGYILQQLEEKKKQLEAISVYQLIADIDPEAKKLVDELKALGS